MGGRLAFVACTIFIIIILINSIGKLLHLVEHKNGFKSIVANIRVLSATHESIFFIYLLLLSDARKQSKP